MGVRVGSGVKVAVGGNVGVGGVNRVVVAVAVTTGNAGVGGATVTITAGKAVGEETALLASQAARPAANPMMINLRPALRRGSRIGDGAHLRRSPSASFTKRPERSAWARTAREDAGLKHL